MSFRSTIGAFACATTMLTGALRAQAPAQKLDEPYTKLINDYLQDKRISTELVDHMPASDTVPSPLKFFGRIPGTPGELTYAKDIYRYYAELARTSPRVKLMKVGTTEEGRDMVVLAVADESLIAALDANKAALAALTDPRRTSEADARALIKTAKPIYWVTAGIHSPELGGPEMLIELAYRLAIEETPFIQNIRRNLITFITPVVEVDGREKTVDTYYYGKKTGKPKPPMVYWGKYVAHDNNRDGMGQELKLTQNLTRTFLEWHPTVLHDLHEAQSYLYTSTGTGPYNPSLDPIATNEWWLLAQTEVMEMAKRKVPGVFTYGFYDGWVPNYLFWIALTHNSFGRFYEVQSYGPDLNPALKLPPMTTSREWYRMNPPLPTIAWGPRNNTNIQESTLLIALNKVASDHELYLENYWEKNKRSIDTGRTGPVNAWVIPADQPAKGNVADMLNALRRQGLEISTANGDFTAGGVSVKAGDYVIRGDQPYRTLADMYLSVQNYPAANPRPYDDTGWTMQYMRNVALKTVKDPAVLQQPMALVANEIRPKGAITGSGTTILIDHDADNGLATLRFRLKGVRMLAAEAPFEAGGKRYAAGSFILPGANRAAVAAAVAELGLTGEAVATAPAVATHPLSVPRIALMHSWRNTQDEGWWRSSFDHYGIPYTYIADIKARAGGLRGKYDVIVYPTMGGTPRDQILGIPKNGPDPIPYKKTALTPNLGTPDSADDIRGGLGLDGLAQLQAFVEAGGLLIGDGSTVETLAASGMARGVTVSEDKSLFTKGAIMRGLFADAASPLLYGYRGKEMPVYFSEGPVMTVGEGAAIHPYFDPNAPGAGISQNTTPNLVPMKLSPYQDGGAAAPQTTPGTPYVEAAKGASGFADGGGIGTGAAPPSRGAMPPSPKPRVVMQFPAKADDILLSGMLAGGQNLAGKALIVDVASGRGHMVLYAMRPFWRAQTQGSYFLGFNAILNWDRLDAGKVAPKPAG